jgi:hypothetical protein
MRTPDQYRELAARCYRLAAEAKTEELQKILREMARAWGEVAEELEIKAAQPSETLRIIRNGMPILDPKRAWSPDISPPRHLASASGSNVPDAFLRTMQNLRQPHPIGVERRDFRLMW